MPDHNSIRLSLQLEDENLYFYEKYITNEKRDNRTCQFFHGFYTYQPDCCDRCGTLFGEGITKHGFTDPVEIQLPKVSELKTFLRLKKQRFFCKHCNTTFALQPDFVEKHCFISKKVKLAIYADLSKVRSETDIALDNCVSHHTVKRVIDANYDSNPVSTTSLPETMCFDELKSTGDIDGAMSFIFTDGVTSEIIDIVEDRKQATLMRYFSRYPKEVRDSVKEICVDMYLPYIVMITALFPLANIVIDKFHVVQLVSRALNQTRIMHMNKKENKDYYKAFKSYWKNVLKYRFDLNDKIYMKFTGFSNHTTSKKVVQTLIATSDELQDTYDFYQNILHAIKLKNVDRFKEAIHNPPDNLSRQMKTARKSLLKFEPYIINMLNSDLNNGRIEGTINRIKLIKRVASGFRSFLNLKARVMIIHRNNPVKAARLRSKQLKNIPKTEVA